MAKPDARTVTLTPEQAAYIDEKVASGGASSTEEVVAQALSVMKQRDIDIDTWLSEEVIPHLDDLEVHPERFTPMDTVFERLDQRMRASAEKKAG